MQDIAIKRATMLANKKYLQTAKKKFCVNDILFKFALPNQHTLP